MKKTLDIVIPAYNEGPQLEQNIKLIHDTLSNAKNNFSWKIIIAENGSRDNTFEIAEKIARKYSNVVAKHFDRPSKDNAIIESWLASQADVLVFADADNSAHPKHIPLLFEAIQKGNDIAVGFRFHGKENSRGFYRDTISSIYNRLLLPLILPTGTRDTQCGIKAVKKEVAHTICPKMRRENGFFDTELLAVAKHKNYTITEVPVTWRETRRSVLSVNKNIPNFLRNVIKVRRRIAQGHYDN